MYLLDTNHCSLILLENPTILKRLEEVGESNTATTIISAGELIYMAENSSYREQNLTRINELLEDIRVRAIALILYKLYLTKRCLNPLG
jgi:tRNA(fMet)-specific endonuclease VapC